jgi:hypothetical protein
MTPDQVTLFGSEMGVTRTPGFQPGKHVRSTAPSLQECLAAVRPERIDVRAEASCTSFQLHGVLEDLRRSGMDGYELWVGGDRVGRFAFLSETPDCEVSDVYLGPATETRMSHGHLAATTGRVAVSRVVLVCDLGTDLGRLVPVLRKLDGKQVKMSLHTGPY